MISKTDRNDLATRIGENVAALRKARGLSQTELADAVGTTQITISRIETGRTLVEITQFFALCDFFDVPEAFLRRKKLSKMPVDA